MDWLVALTVAYVVFVTAFAGTLLALVWSLRKRNRVSPEVRSPAPVSWLVSPRSTARLHRRLQVAVRSAQVARTRDVSQAHPTLPELALTLEQEAVVTDHHLVGVATTPRRYRRRALQPLHRQVTEIERLAAEVARTARRAGPRALPRASAGLADVAEQLQMLRAAQAEVEQIEARERGELPLPSPRPERVQHPGRSPLVDRG